jgi:hypothetical protein
MPRAHRHFVAGQVMSFALLGCQPFQAYLFI